MEEPRTAEADELDQIRANISKVMAEAMKIGAETTKIQAEIRYYPLVALGAIVVAALGAFAAIVVGIIRH